MRRSNITTRSRMEILIASLLLKHVDFVEEDGGCGSSKDVGIRPNFNSFVWLTIILVRIWYFMVNYLVQDFFLFMLWSLVRV
jgi:hypothetical protein